MTQPIRDILITALLVLAIALVWPSMGTHSGHVVQSATQHVASAVGHAEQTHARDQANPHLQCEPSGMGCCVMTHCHPGVAQSPLDMSHAALFPRHEPTASADEAGVDPAILVPPPRLLLG